MNHLLRIFLYVSALYYVLAIKVLFVTSYKKIDPELVSFVQDYHSFLDKYCDTGRYNNTNFYSITFVDDMPDEDIGVCYRKINGYAIEVNKRWWKETNTQDHRQLMYHELAHCLIDKNHVEFCSFITSRPR
jgi:hypothetical protein